MTRLIKAVACGALVLVFLAHRQWFDPYHVAIGSVALALGSIPCGIVALWFGRHKRVRSRRPPGRHDHPLRPILLGSLWGIATCLWLSAVFLVADQFPLVPAFYDHDRAQIETVISELEQHEHFADLAQFIETRLHKPISKPWATELAKEEYSCLVKAAKQVGGKSAQTYLDRALAVADQYELSSDWAQEALARLQDNKSLSDLRNETEAERVKVRREVDQEVSHTHAEIERLKQLGAARIRGLNQTVFDQLVACGDSLAENLTARREKYLAAIDWAKRTGLDWAAASSKLASVDREIAQNQPTVLPAGSTATLVASHVEFAPVVTVLDIDVADNAGRPITGLAAKDFVIEQAGHKRLVDRVVAIDPKLRPWQIALLVDRSTSTQGAGIAAAKSGASSLLAKLNGLADFRLITFSTDVELQSEWTNNAQAVTDRVTPIIADGNTALLEALDTAINQLQARPEPRAIVLFTDGADHVGGPSLDDLIARCRQFSIEVHAIGLKTNELDSRFLSGIATETHGQFLMSDRAEGILARFSEVAVQMRRPFYRFAVLSDDTKNKPIVIRLAKTADPK